MSEVEVIDELVALKERADLLGIQYHPSIGAEKLREKIAAALADKPTEAKPAEAESESARHKKIIDEATKLIRIRLTCMNPFKKDWDGELITVSNSVVGTLKRYIPFNAPDGWHVPQMMLNMLEERQCQVFYNEKTRNGVSIRKGKLIKEFAIEVLPPLTEKELKDLAQQQAMSKRID